MLITELKPMETIASLAEGKKVFLLNCLGCKEVHFPEKEAAKLQEELAAKGNVTGVLTTDYICNPENMKLRLQRPRGRNQSRGRGAGVLLRRRSADDRRVSGRQKSIRLLRYVSPSGVPGRSPLEYKCDQCGECYLNLTGGICPITACSKSLVNGQCGGSKNGMCEVDPGDGMRMGAHLQKAETAGKAGRAQMSHPGA